MKPASPAVKKIMKQFNLTLASISARADCSMLEVYLALDLRRFSYCPLLTVARVRHVIEVELSRLGWSGQREELWMEFDAFMQNLLEDFRKTPPRRTARNRERAARSWYDIPGINRL